MNFARLSRSVWGGIVIAWFLAGMVWADQPAFAADPPPYLTSFGPDGSSTSSFGRAGALAVDETAEVVYVIDHQKGSLAKFDLNGEPVTFSGSNPAISDNEINGMSFNPQAGETQVAVDPLSHSVYVTSANSVVGFQADGDPQAFTVGPTAGTNTLSGFGELIGVAVDSNGNIYASDYTSGVSIFSHEGEQITQFSAPEAANLAVDSNGNVYVNLWHGAVYKYVPSEHPVTSSTTFSVVAEAIEPNLSFSVATDPTTNDVYIVGQESAHARAAWYDEHGALLATFGETGDEGEIFDSEGIAVDGDSGKVFVSDTPPARPSQVKIFGEPFREGPPLVEAVFVANVSASSAEFRARINSSGYETRYWFEYGLLPCAVSACSKVPIEGGSIEGRNTGFLMSQIVTGLKPERTYHYRVFATNKEGPADYEPNANGEHVFTTGSGSLSFELSDRRVWEMVSPPSKHGGVLVGSYVGLIQADHAGNRIAYLSKGSIMDSPEGNRSVEASTILADRQPTGWLNSDIIPPNQKVTRLATGAQGEYTLFSPDLSMALLEPRSGTPLSEAASEKTPYLRENTDPPRYTPLVTGKPGYANVSSGMPFGGKVMVAASSEEMDRVVVSSFAPLSTPDDPVPSLYEWSAGMLRPVNVLPNAEGGGMVPARLVGSGPGSVKHAISDDGSRIFWGTGDYSEFTGNGTTALFMRDMQEGNTIRLDVPEGDTTGAGPSHPVFQIANREGTVVFFTDSKQLTKDASLGGSDLYRCEIPANSSASTCSTLTDISAPSNGSGESSEVQGIISGFSNDGTTVYFVAKGVLDNTPTAQGETAVSGQPNLYSWQESRGVRLIAVLSPEDSRNWGIGGGVAGVSSRLSAGSSPNGHYLAFMSKRALTTYDNRDAVTGGAVQEVFLYDAVADRLICASCNATGSAPVGWSNATYDVQPLIDPQTLWQGRLLAAALPEPTVFSVGGASFYRPRFMLDNGRLFFHAFDALVAADSNGEWDVYQYEPLGVGDCSSSLRGAAVLRASGGCVSLMSSGSGQDEAALLDVSASGDDVFFLSPERLAAADKDLELDVYDARVDGKPALKALTMGCVGDTCQAGSTAPAEIAPGSNSYSGPGNVRVRHCRKGQRKAGRGGRARCIKRKRRRHRRHVNHHREDRR